MRWKTRPINCANQLDSNSRGLGPMSGFGGACESGARSTCPPRNTWRARGYQGQSPDSLVASVEALKTVLVFCGASRFVWQLSATYGLDISSGFFSPLADRADVLSKGRDQPGARPASALSRIVRG